MLDDIIAISFHRGGHSRNLINAYRLIDTPKGKRITPINISILLTIENIEFIIKKFCDESVDNPTVRFSFTEDKNSQYFMKSDDFRNWGLIFYIDRVNDSMLLIDKIEDTETVSDCYCIDLGLKENKIIINGALEDITTTQWSPGGALNTFRYHGIRKAQFSYMTVENVKEYLLGILEFLKKPYVSLNVGGAIIMIHLDTFKSDLVKNTKLRTTTDYREPQINQVMYRTHGSYGSHYRLPEVYVQNGFLYIDINENKKKIKRAFRDAGRLDEYEMLVLLKEIEN